MAFERKTWVDRDVQYPGRRTLINTEDSTEFENVIVERAETSVTEPGDLFRAGTDTDLGSMNNLEKRIYDAFSEIFDIIDEGIDGVYPVGAIYQSFDNTSPATLFPGTEWVSLPNKLLLPVATNQQSGQSVGNTSNVLTKTPSGYVSLSGAVGGHALTIAEMPSHSHAIPYLSWVTDSEPTAGSFKVAYGDSSYRGDNTIDTKTRKIDPVGGGTTHTHPLSLSGTFTGVAVSIDIRQQYITMYAWRRTA